MKYKFAKKQNYEYLSAGSVIKSYKGNTNFPVRLGHELFNRCLEYCNKKNNISVYDPMCGSAYLLTTIGLLNSSKISHIYGSDIDKHVLNLAELNLSLLSQKGLQNRQTEIQALHKKYKRDSHKLSLENIVQFESVLKKDMKFQLFEEDFFDLDNQSEISSDITIMDLPYNSLKKYQGKYSIDSLRQRIVSLLEKGSTICIVSNRSQKLKLNLIDSRCEQVTIGKRVFVIHKE